MISKFTELEIKLDAKGIDEHAFIRWAFSKTPFKSISVDSPDQYFTQNGNFVRVRLPKHEPIELTTKQRTSTQSTRDRFEADITLPLSTTYEDVSKFLEFAGFELTLELNKKAHVFWYKYKSATIVLSLYTAEKMQNKQIIRSETYIEVEIEKGSNIAISTGKDYLKEWQDDIKQIIKKDLKPLNQSLFEIFSKGER